MHGRAQRARERPSSRSQRTQGQRSGAAGAGSASRTEFAFSCNRVHLQRQVLSLTLQLSLKTSGDSSSSRRVLRHAADSSEDSEDDFDDEDAADVSHGQQQSRQEQQHDENLGIERELHRLRKEQAEAAESLLQQVSVPVQPVALLLLRAGGRRIAGISAAEARNRVSSRAAGAQARYHTRPGEVVAACTMCCDVLSPQRVSDT